MVRKNQSHSLFIKLTKPDKMAEYIRENVEHGSSLSKQRTQRDVLLSFHVVADSKFLGMVLLSALFLGCLSICIYYESPKAYYAEVPLGFFKTRRKKVSETGNDHKYLLDFLSLDHSLVWTTKTSQSKIDTLSAELIWIPT